jgi:toxin ParE1/3/4
MALTLAWSPEAIEDIEAIAAYIERDSPWYAKTVVTNLVEIAEAIPEFPELGRIVPEIGDPLVRERFVHRYRMIYKIDGRRVLIAAVIHGRQDFGPLTGRITEVHEPGR